MFPPHLDSNIAYEIAHAMLEGFNRHYQLFRQESAQAKPRFETADWHDQQRAQRERIAFYDLRVKECIAHLEHTFQAGQQPMSIWQQAKLHYIGLLMEHRQPELAETFFNSVTTKILHRHYFHNNFLFVRPAVSTEHLENEEPHTHPTYFAYYPTPDSLHDTVVHIVQRFDLTRPFENLPRDAGYIVQALSNSLAQAKWYTNFQIQVLSQLFYRNKGAYLIGKIINGARHWPFAWPILHNEQGQLTIDTALFGEDELSILFSFARAYFMVDMEVPSAYVHFLHSVMPRKPKGELYSALGLHKQGKTLFYRDFLHHLRHSSDRFRIAPGIKGMVMLVFDLPSFPYVFKVIKDHFPAQKNTTPAQVREKYRLVKQHDRVGRMADTLEYVEVAFPRERFDADLLAELQQQAASQIEVNESEVIVKHLYIERRMIPLNLYLQEALKEAETQPQALQKIHRSVVEYGQAIKDLIAANIFPGDMLWKNFGVTRHGKIVFYDYDEIDYITHCQFRRVPEPRTVEEEMSSEVWYAVGPQDVFPETFAPFLLGHPKVREVFMATHADLLDVDFWQSHKERIEAGHVHDVFPYEQEKRFIHQFAKDPS